jgi:hypothetical protein
MGMVLGSKEIISMGMDMVTRKFRDNDGVEAKLQVRLRENRIMVLLLLCPRLGSRVRGHKRFSSGRIWNRRLETVNFY